MLAMIIMFVEWETSMELHPLPSTKIWSIVDTRTVRVHLKQMQIQR